MKPSKLKFIITGLVLTAALSYLAVAAVKSEGWVYSVDVDRFVADDQYRAERVRLHGIVVDDERFAVRSVNLSANFTLAGKSRTLPVAYRGTIPDLFKAGGEVVVEGRQDPSGVFQADVLMTKCASKYEPSSPHQTDLPDTKMTSIDKHPQNSVSAGEEQRS